MTILDKDLPLTTVGVPYDFEDLRFEFANLQRRADRAEFRIRMLIVGNCSLFALWALEHILA